MNPTQTAFLEALKASLFDTTPNYPPDTDWQEVIKEAKLQTVQGLISPVIPEKDNSVQQGMARYIRILFEQDKMVKLLDANGIPCVILKGSAAAIYYPKPQLRTMGDVDFLVPRDRFEEAAKVLEANGFIYEHGKDDNGNLPDKGRHFGYKKNGVDFELHHHFSSEGFDIDDILEQAIYRREFRELSGYKIPMLPETENGLVLLGHIYQHLHLDAIGLRQIIDWEMFVNRRLNEEKWNTVFAPVLKEVGFERFALNVTGMCEEYLGLPGHFSNKFHDKELSEKLLLALFKNGNFGKKQYSSEYTGRIQGAVYGIKENGFFSYFQKLGTRKWFFLKKHSFLKPFAWLYGIIIFLINGTIAVFKTGNIRKQMNIGNERYDLFEKITGTDESSK